MFISSINVFVYHELSCAQSFPSHLACSAYSLSTSRATFRRRFRAVGVHFNKRYGHEVMCYVLVFCKPYSNLVDIFAT